MNAITKLKLSTAADHFKKATELLRDAALNEVKEYEKGLDLPVAKLAENEKHLHDANGALSLSFQATALAKQSEYMTK